MTIVPSEWILCPNSPEKIFTVGKLSDNQLIEVEFEDGERRLIVANDFVLYWTYTFCYRVYDDIELEVD